MKYIPIVVIGFLLTGCGPSLSVRGQNIAVVRMGDALVASCKRLGTVTGEGNPGWGGEIGLSHAYIDAQNKAGEIPGADTLAYSLANREFSGGTVQAMVFNCTEKQVQPIRDISPSNTPTPSNVFDLAKKCQTQKGVWLNDQCVINIE